MLDWLLGKKKPVAQPTPSDVDFRAMSKRISNFEEKLNTPQLRLEELQDELNERLDRDSDEYFDMDRKIDYAEFDLLMMEDEVERLREDFDDDLDDY